MNELTNIENSVVVKYTTGSSTGQLTIKYVNPDVSNENLASWIFQFWAVFSTSTITKVSRVSQGELTPLEG